MSGVLFMENCERRFAVFTYYSPFFMPINFSKTYIDSHAWVSLGYSHFVIILIFRSKRILWGNWKSKITISLVFNRIPGQTNKNENEIDPNNYHHNEPKCIFGNRYYATRPYGSGGNADSMYKILMVRVDRIVLDKTVYRVKSHSGW